MGKITIRVTYCDAWGGKNTFLSLQKELLSKFPDQVTVEEVIVHDNKMFEVEVVGGKLLHSKKKGQGYPLSRLDEIEADLKQVLTAWVSLSSWGRKIRSGVILE